MMYYALTGQPPFTGENAFAIMIAHGRDPVVPPSQVHPGVPEDLERVILICLSKKPEDRYPDVRALGKALAACILAGDWDGGKADRWWADKRRPPPANRPSPPRSSRETRMGAPHWPTGGPRPP